MSCAMRTSSLTLRPRSRFGSLRCFTAAEIRDLWRPFFATERDCQFAVSTIGGQASAENLRQNGRRHLRPLKRA